MTPIFEVRGLAKSFGGVHALRGVTLRCAPGEVHGLLGQNGAGKSTLIDILSGRVAPDSGSIVIDGEAGDAVSIQRTLRAGIAVVHQELSLFEDLGVVENVFLGDEQFYRFGLFQRTQARAAAVRLFTDLFGLDRFPVDEPVRKLSIAQKQLVEIARGLHRQARLIVLDEPTASLSLPEIERLLHVIVTLRSRGTAFIFVTHKLQEVLRIADRVTVLRDGLAVVEGVLTSDIATDDLVAAMVGRRLGDIFPVRRTEASVLTPGLAVEALALDGFPGPISFQVHGGEIVALVGLMGSGRTRVARSLAGLNPVEGGSIHVSGSALRPGSPRAAVRAGVAYVPEDRKLLGLIVDMTIRENLSLPSVALHSAMGLLSRAQERAAAAKTMSTFAIRGGDVDLPVRALSGGNQQKVSVVKWLRLPLRVLLLDEPTKGVDIGAKAEIYALMRSLADHGMGILFIPSEFQEAVGLADRVLVMRDHAIVREVNGTEATEAELFRAAAA